MALECRPPLPEGIEKELHMSLLKHLECLRCGSTYPPEKYFFGCPSCTGEKVSNLACVYGLRAGRADLEQGSPGPAPCHAMALQWSCSRSTRVRWSAWRGMTPLLHVPRLGKRLGLDKLYVKDESQNPTWSFKDRMASVGASKALEFGCDVLTAASSGNGGAATAAYAARAGLKSIIFTTQSFPLTMRVLMQTYGAMVVATPTMEDRWKMVPPGRGAAWLFPIQNFLCRSSAPTRTPRRDARRSGSRRASSLAGRLRT